MVEALPIARRDAEHLVNRIIEVAADSGRTNARLFRLEVHDLAHQAAPVATGTQAASLAGVSRPSPDPERARRDREASHSRGARRGPGGCVGARVGCPTA